MREEIYRCDHCGKIIDEMSDYVNMDIEGPGFYVTMDLCEEHYTELKEFIENYKESYEK